MRRIEDNAAMKQPSTTPRRSAHLFLSSCGMALIASAAAADPGVAHRIVTNESGVFTVPAEPVHGPVPGGPTPRLGGWWFDTSSQIGNKVAFTRDHSWAAVQRNNERLFIFDTDGNGTPLHEHLSAKTSPAGVAATYTGTRAAYFDLTTDERFRLTVFDDSAIERPHWEHVFGPEFGHAGLVNMKRNVAISRDGAVVAAMPRDRWLEMTVAHFFDGETGDLISTFSAPEPGASVRLNDDGSLAIVSLWNEPRVVDTATGDVVWAGTGSGAGNVDYRISGDGRFIVVGGFRFHVYEWDGSTYQRIINFSGSPTQWYGFGTAISRDGSTIGSIARAHDTEDVYVRTWDVASRSIIAETVLGAVPGTLQHANKGAEATDDGSLVAFATWGDGMGVHPEVSVYTRELGLVAEMHMPGSGYDVDIMPDGSWVIGTGKRTHANSFGNGGQVITQQLAETPACIADWNGDGEVDINDFFAFLSDFEDGDPRADLNEDGEIDINDFFIFLQEFEAGC